MVIAYTRPIQASSVPGARLTRILITFLSLPSRFTNTLALIAQSVHALDLLLDLDVFASLSGTFEAETFVIHTHSSSVASSELFTT